MHHGNASKHKAGCGTPKKQTPIEVWPPSCWEWSPPTHHARGKVNPHTGHTQCRSMARRKSQRWPQKPKVAAKAEGGRKSRRWPQKPKVAAKAVGGRKSRRWPQVHKTAAKVDPGLLLLMLCSAIS